MLGFSLSLSLLTIPLTGRRKEKHGFERNSGSPHRRMKAYLHAHDNGRSLFGKNEKMSRGEEKSIAHQPKILMESAARGMHFYLFPLGPIPPRSLPIHLGVKKRRVANPSRSVEALLFSTILLDENVQFGGITHVPTHMKQRIQGITVEIWLLLYERAVL